MTDNASVPAAFAGLSEMTASLNQNTGFTLGEIYFKIPDCYLRRLPQYFQQDFRHVSSPRVLLRWRNAVMHESAVPRRHSSLRAEPAWHSPILPNLLIAAVIGSLSVWASLRPKTKMNIYNKLRFCLLKTDCAAKKNLFKSVSIQLTIKNTVLILFHVTEIILFPVESITLLK
ncbi:hypothetical protein NPIL_102071 [Nephila pilipes]|uniref:Uncharacterized protein n=1 Tax=Nephila pilipes TaxID=299642 RepID=A0A8X6UAV2_NEPPI|nr:hypothetical protein NPIL_102071 [Nephila pilipes]